MKGSSISAIHRLDRRVYLLGSAGLVRSIGRSATFVFLPLIFAEVYGLPYLAIGGLIAAIVPVSIISFLSGGYFSDRFGRRPFAVYPSFASTVVLLFLWQYLDHGLAIVVGLWAINSFLGGLTRPAQSAMIGDVTPPDLTVTAFGVQRVFTNTGFAISPAIGGFLAATVGLPALFLFAAITSVIEGTLLLVLLRETYPGHRPTPRERGEGVGAPFRDVPFVWLLVGMVGLALVMNQFSTPLALFLGSVRSLPLTEFGFIYSLNGVLVVLLQLPISRWIEGRHQYLGWLAAGSITYGASFLLFDAAGSFAFYLLAMGVLTIGEDIVSPTQQTLVARFAGPEHRGSYFGAYNAATNATRVVAPVVGTLLLGLGPSGSTWLWGGMFGISVAVALGFLYLRGHARRRIDSAGPQGPSPLPADLLLAGSD